MLKNKNAESLEAVYIHFVCFKTINENKQVKQKGVNILSYFVLLFNRCKNALIDKIFIDGGGASYLFKACLPNESLKKEVRC